SLYPSPELRPRGDTDLLIDRRDLAPLREVMRARGYDERPTSGDALAVRQHAFSRIDAFGATHVYDVHLDVANSPVFAKVLRHDELRDDAVPLPAISAIARGLSHVHALLLACVHRVAHHDDSDRLIWLYDIHLLRERMTDAEHERFWRLAAEREVLAVCAHSIELAETSFCVGTAASAVRPPTAVAAVATRRDEPSQRFLHRHRGRGAIFLDEMRALTWRGRATRAWQLLFPPREFMRATRGSASPLAYASRATRGAAKLLPRSPSLFLAATCAVLASRVLVAIAPFAIIRWILFREHRPRRVFPFDASAIAKMIESRRVRHAPCLVQTLAARMLFTLSGLDSRVHLGPSGDERNRTFHAWLEHDGRPLVGELPQMPRSFFD
ncbi:MAG TPA: lasso peptide biosynthesis B2 protein, partial [Thermoanaerobaculia bacterium]|nr:lasso peptide biosynthesis B2 protein [Thermoanaerobaculia bacterium]